MKENVDVKAEHADSPLKYEYLKCYWRYIDDETPVLLFYEVDLENERYATRMTEIFSDRRAVPVVEEGFPFITEAPVPTVDEINQKEEDQEDGFFAVVIPKEEFEEVYHSSVYPGEISFPG